MKLKTCVCVFLWLSHPNEIQNNKPQKGFEVSLFLLWGPFLVESKERERGGGGGRLFGCC